MKVIHLTEKQTKVIMTKVKGGFNYNIFELEETTEEILQEMNEVFELYWDENSNCFLERD